MKVRRFKATNVHGYLPLDVEFNPDLTFLTGLNGSGKTSCLRLLMALLAPNLEEFARITFDTASVSIEDGDLVAEVTARRTAKSLALSVSTVSESLDLTTADLQLLLESRSPDEPRPVLQMVEKHPVYAAIAALSTPMFLGIDRRFVALGQQADEWAAARRRAAFNRSRFQDESPFRSHGAHEFSLGDINALAFETAQSIRQRQLALDDKFRKEVIAGVFEYKPSDMQSLTRFPARDEFKRYRERKAEITKAAGSLRLPVPEIAAALDSFFEQMNKVVEALESKKGDPMTPEFAAWVINKPQVDRILEHLGLLEQYVKDRNLLQEPLDRFIALVNGFLKQTGKRLEVTDRGDLGVALTSASTDSVRRQITALSSGERQIVVMLGHLALNRNLAGSGVFIVDEPELSLHISWQEKLVQSVQAANSEVQLILATHSPAIILDRLDRCRSLSDVSDDHARLA